MRRQFASDMSTGTDANQKRCSVASAAIVAKRRRTHHDLVRGAAESKSVAPLQCCADEGVGCYRFSEGSEVSSYLGLLARFEVLATPPACATF